MSFQVLSSLNENNKPSGVRESSPETLNCVIRPKHSLFTRHGPTTLFTQHGARQCLEGCAMLLRTD